MSTLMFWNKQNANNNNNNSSSSANGSNNGSAGENGKATKKDWLHSPDALVNGHVAYLVKFLGATPVDQAKGIDTVNDAIRRLQFNQQIKKAEGTMNKKMNKVELTISVDGVAIQEPRFQKVLYQFPLHDISYCADEKGVKKFISFIAKTSKKDAIPNGDTIIAKQPTNGDGASPQDTHTCFVFISSKLSSDITMTIGQAFELAYRRYVSDGSKGSELAKAQASVRQLEHTVATYAHRLRDLLALVPRAEAQRLLGQYGVRDVLEVQPLAAVPAAANAASAENGHSHKEPNGGGPMNGDAELLIETGPKMAFGSAPQVPPRNQLSAQINSTLDALKPSVGTKLEGLLLHSDSDSDFDPRADESDTSSSTNGLNGLNGLNGGGHQLSGDLFGFDAVPAKTLGQQLFAPVNGNGALNGGAAPVVNGNGYGHVNAAPLLAPPPKASTQRRTTTGSNGTAVPLNGNGSQDLFGSTPFTAMQPSPFDDTTDSNADAFAGGGIRAVSSVFPRAPAASNPFGDQIGSLNETSHSAFDDSFDRGFDGPSSVSAKAQPTRSDPFAALATSSPTVKAGELSGIDFVSPPRTGESVADVSPVVRVPPVPKPNYHAFYSAPSAGGEEAAFGTPTTSSTHSKASARSLDILQSVTASAFQQFGNAMPANGQQQQQQQQQHLPSGTNSSAIGARRDMNSMAAKSATAPMSKSPVFGGLMQQNTFNATKPMAFDDFTLESLDPLRK